MELTIKIDGTVVFDVDLNVFDSVDEAGDRGDDTARSPDQNAGMVGSAEPVSHLQDTKPKGSNQARFLPAADSQLPDVRSRQTENGNVQQYVGYAAAYIHDPVMGCWMTCNLGMSMLV